MAEGMWMFHREHALGASGLLELGLACQGLLLSEGKYHFSPLVHGREATETQEAASHLETALGEDLRSAPSTQGGLPCPQGISFWFRKPQVDLADCILDGPTCLEHLLRQFLYHSSSYVNPGASEELHGRLDWRIKQVSGTF